MSRAVLFLDIDGVLNGHEFNAEAESNTLRRDCVERFNRVRQITAWLHAHAQALIALLTARCDEDRAEAATT